MLIITAINSSYGATSLDIDAILRRYLQQHLTISKDEFERTKNDILPVVNQIIQKIKEKDQRFNMKLEYRGSVYEKVKIKQANEFDFDLRIQQLQLEQEQINDMKKAYLQVCIIKLNVFFLPQQKFSFLSGGARNFPSRGNAFFHEDHADIKMVLK